MAGAFVLAIAVLRPPRQAFVGDMPTPAPDAKARARTSGKLKRNALAAGEFRARSVLSARKPVALELLPQTLGLVAPSLFGFRETEDKTQHDKRSDCDECDNPTHRGDPLCVHGLERIMPGVLISCLESWLIRQLHLPSPIARAAQYHRGPQGGEHHRRAVSPSMPGSRAHGKTSSRLERASIRALWSGRPPHPELSNDAAQLDR
jgi:hypothetical protein